ncbi:uncharacterized protein [Venturia canescens]|nr:uncharacterized protein LOC122414211 isoform X2 [Venturia canescens]XP_043281183.1 uncharacterized protein LOC122414211 isoform X2 [Venturia canescens]XP_043281184.1 uncharacterized protein LOC122414211 isoform X2 [Venturia canescens]XP_043281185.1 uncharacterized protein LOC122414211 isoform X2 [Venturia canescens]XP_043281186.1 uncharacterized protein LOC122414211 isoform X2 [Venturia canescens]XP_043281187.1 uncharacterized protein LOC122414211 isoform X2 [Venturia canescens]
MFDELARRGEGCSYGDLQTGGGCNIPVAIQKRLSLVPHSHRGSIFGQLCSSDTATTTTTTTTTTTKMTTILVPSGSQIETRMEERTKQEDEIETEENDSARWPRNQDHSINEIFTDTNEINNLSVAKDVDNRTSDKTIYRREANVGLTPLRYSRRSGGRGIVNRPLSGSSIASSTSSSGCSNQGNANAANPYLTSVESLADTCASSQGSGDSGVITISEASCRVHGVDGNPRRNSSEADSSIYHRPRYCDPHRNPVERVLLEIVDTEAIYVEHLRQVIQGYLIFWRDDPAGLVRQLQLNHLFSNIEDIFEFNREFLKEIETCGLDPVCVANTFIKHNAGFKVYTEYCTNYPRTVSVLTDLMGQEVTANAFRERQAALGHALPLGSFLLKPVQRILKYHLLLENLSKEYEAGCGENGKEAEGRDAIEGALEAMTGIAKHINAMKRRHEHAVRVQEIQSLLYGWPGPDLTTSGELVAEGRFRMRGAKAPRHAFLFDRMLLLTKKKEDGLLVYKAHIMCSNLMLIESIPGEPCSFHVIPFDNPRLQCTLQARNVEQKREWALQIKRVILENYNAVIPSHARQLVLQLGQSQQDEDSPVDKGSAKKQYSAPPEYLEKRKQEKERRRSETGLRQKLKKNSGKLDHSKASTENSPASERRKQPEDSSAMHSSRDRSLNRSLDARASKVKDRFTNWRRKSEPGFQSYVSLDQSDEENKKIPGSDESSQTLCENGLTNEDDASESSGRMENLSAETKDEKRQEQEEQQPEEQNQQQQQKVQTQTVEQIVGHILMQNQEFQRLLEKQRNNSTINVRHQQRFNKHAPVDTSDESDTDNTNYPTEITNNMINNNHNNNNNNKDNRSVRSNRREQRMILTNNAWNAFSSSQPRDVQPTLQLRYDNLRADNDSKAGGTNNETGSRAGRVNEKRAIFEAFKRPSIVTDSKIIKTALRLREHSSNEENNSAVTKNRENSPQRTVDESLKAINEDSKEINDERMKNSQVCKDFGNYDNLQHVWEGFNAEGVNDNESPTRPAVWLTKLCEGLPISPQKAGSLPRSFQIMPNSQQPAITKARFLQRDGKPMSERPFTIASDKPAEINLEDMERYASSCQPEGRIAKFPTTATTSSSTFFLSLDDNLTDAYAEIHTPVTSTNIHPDHKIYRANIGGSAILKSVLSKAGSTIQGLRTTMSTETLESNDEFERRKYSRSLSTGKSKKRSSKLRSSRESSSDLDDNSHVGCVSGNNGNLKIPGLYYKQGSSGLGARIAQSDYADPSFLFSESKRAELASAEVLNSTKSHDQPIDSNDRRESETDSFYERSFETIENYVDAETDDAFRDSAIFSDTDEIMSTRQTNGSNNDGIIMTKAKIAPPVPAKKKSRNSIESSYLNAEESKSKPVVAHKPSHLKIRGKIASRNTGDSTDRSQLVDSHSSKNLDFVNSSHTNRRKTDTNLTEQDRNDVSAGQSQAGWVRKMVGQLQAHIET